ncbi:MAG: DUF1801 domain-containing protein [Hyphomonadaceae bacterium]|nr:DUF1801 domain-containing protein [Hyphomonadaceae bacterium]
MSKAKTPDAYFEALKPPIGDVAIALRDKIEALGPNLNGKLAWGFPCWSGNQRIFSVIAHQSHCNLQLWYGAQLAERCSRIEGTGKALRHVKVRSIAEIDAALAGLIEEAIALDARAPQKIR